MGDSGRGNGDQFPRAEGLAARVAAIAARQHGVTTRGQLLDAGMKPTTIGDWTRAGHLHRVYRSVYSVGHGGTGPQARWMAAVLACGPGAALSHESAACHLGLSSRDPGAVHVSIPHRRRSSPGAIIVHRTRHLAAADVCTRLNVPTTTPARTLFDEAARLSPRALRDLFYKAESLGSLNRPHLLRLLDGAQGVRGLGNLRKLLAEEALPLSEVRSRLEAIILEVCGELGLPIPATNVPVLDYTVDFYWPDARFIIETDGGHHRGPQRDRDNERDLHLSRDGNLVRRYSSRALGDRRRVAIEIKEILAERLPARRSGALRLAS